MNTLVRLMSFRVYLLDLPSSFPKLNTIQSKTAILCPWPKFTNKTTRVNSSRRKGPFYFPVIKTGVGVLHELGEVFDRNLGRWVGLLQNGPGGAKRPKTLGV